MSLWEIVKLKTLVELSHNTQIINCNHHIMPDFYRSEKYKSRSYPKQKQQQIEYYMKKIL